MRSGVFSFCKAIDTFCPLGPWIVTPDEVPDPHDLAMELRVNGETRQVSNTGKMSTTMPEIISHYSPLGYSAGDVLSTGTVSGVAGFSEDAASLYLKPGDVIEAEIERIGVLRNPGDLVAGRRTASRAPPRGALVKRKRSSPGSRARTARISRRSCSRRATRCTGWSAARARSTRRGSTTSSATSSSSSATSPTAPSLNQLMRTIRPDEVYNLGAQSHVRVSFDIPEYTADIDAMGTLRLLDAIREEGVQCRFYQASSSEMFGKVREMPQTEETPFHPRSPYGVARSSATGSRATTARRTACTR